MDRAIQLSKGLDALGLEVSPRPKKQLLAYLELLEKWNKTCNLTAVPPEQMVTLHLLDSLSIEPYLHGSKMIDVGTGAGLPGIPLAIITPDYHFTLLDSNNKKIRFLTQVTEELGLENVEIIQERAEKFQPEEKFDTLTSRAFASLSDMLKACEHLCNPHGRFVAMKGTRPADEIKAVPKGFKVVAVEPLEVPGLDAERHAVIIVPSGK